MPRSRAGPRVSAAGLVVANLVPLVGVLGFGWEVGSLLVSYWLESAVVGVASVAKILRAEGSATPADLPDVEFNGRSVRSFVGESNRSVAGFFLVHYGGFWTVHGVFVLLFVVLFPGLGTVSPWVVGAATVGLAAYHAVSYRVNYVGDREYERVAPVDAMVAPYRRVLVLHVTVVLGGFAIGATRAPVGAVAVMVVVKTVLDFRGHWREHAPERDRPPAEAVGD